MVVGRGGGGGGGGGGSMFIVGTYSSGPETAPAPLDPLLFFFSFCAAF